MINQYYDANHNKIQIEVLRLRMMMKIRAVMKNMSAQ